VAFPGALNPSFLTPPPPLLVLACRLAASAKGERGQAAEAAGTIAAAELLELLATGACVDEHLADQLVIFMALAKGRWALGMLVPTVHTHQPTQDSAAAMMLHSTGQAPLPGALEHVGACTGWRQQHRVPGTGLWLKAQRLDTAPPHLSSEAKRPYQSLCAFSQRTGTALDGHH
jgi:hypothetical protein